MAKVIGRDDSFVYNVSCRNCAAIIEYTTSETRLKWSQGTGYYDALTCPNCEKEIEI